MGVNEKKKKKKKRAHTFQQSRDMGNRKFYFALTTPQGLCSLSLNLVPKFCPKHN